MLSYIAPSPASSRRDTVYDSARLEKTARAEEFSAVKRAVNKNVVVVADAPNYIKGFRYQLFCEAKAAGTRSIVVHTAAREDECVAWNDARLEAWGSHPALTEQDEKIAKVDRPKTGKDVLGGLQPESHTALYGDKVLNEEPRPQDFSVGAPGSGDEEEQATRKRQPEDTMTLKSLYISDNHKTTMPRTETKPAALESTQEQSASIPTSSYPLPPSTPPSPKASLPYSPTSLKSLLMRYEPPSPFTRWDTPLFTIPSADAHPPYDAIWAAIFPAPAKPTSKKALQKQRQEDDRAQRLQRDIEAQPQETSPTTPAHHNEPSTAHPSHSDSALPVRQNAATILPSAAPASALQLLESTTGEIAKLVLSAARSTGAADGDGGTITLNIPIPDEDALEMEIEVPEGLSLSQPVLQRLRRKYTQIQRGGIAHGVGYTSGRRGVAEGFVGFLRGEWEASG